jgi:hypothetical protein
VGADEFAFMEGLGLFENNKTRRGRNNIYYQQRAMSLIGSGDNPEFYWLANGPEMWAGDRVKAWRPSILAELGRIADDESLLSIAREICQLKPKSRRAVELIRQFRLGATGPGEASDLQARMTATINQFLQRHPKTEWSTVLKAIDDLREMVKASAGLEELT